MSLSRRSAVGLVMMNALAATLPGRSQLQQPKPYDPTQSHLPDISGNHQGDDTGASEMRERMRISAERAENADRRKRMLLDTEKLLALSTELKAEIEKSSKDELSMAVIHKAAEIEKLAHDVQQRMKG